MANPQLTVEIGASIDDLRRGMRNAIGEINKFGNQADTAVNKISGVLTSNLAGIFSTAAIISFGREVIKVTADFEKYNAVLGNTLGSAELATLKLKELSEFAARTPFSVNELTASFVKLANGGFKPTNDQLRALGDLASSTGKSFDQLAEAILDAQTGEFERLKEFGIRAKDAGDQVIFTYKGVQTEVEKTSSAIRDYITNLGNAEGVSGSMAKISATLGGQISNLGDNWDRMLLSVGGNTKGVFNSAINSLNKVIDGITRLNEEINIADKYSLKSDFWQQIARGVGFRGRGSTNLEYAVFNIQEAQKSVSKLVSETISGAKNADDFGKALAKLKKEADFTINETAVAKAGDPQYRQIQLAIKNEYQIGIKALQDARKAFIQEQGQTDANFGKGSKDAAEKIAEIYRTLNAELKSNPIQFGIGREDLVIKNIQSYQSAIDNLIKNGYQPASKAIQELISKQEDLAKAFISGSNVLGVNAGQSLVVGAQSRLDNRPNPQASLVTNIKPPVGLSEYARLIKEAEESNTRFIESISSLGTAVAESGISEAFSSIGEAIANGGSLIDAAGNAILATMAQFLNELGKMFIKQGIAQIAAGIALNTIIPGSGANRIAGGAGLIAAGSLISVAGGIAGAKGKRTNGQQGVGTPVRQFATGGYNLAAGMALVGERGPEFVDLPTGSSVHNNAKTNRILQGSGKQAIVLGGELDISLEKLYFALKQTEKNLNR